MNATQNTYSWKEVNRDRPCPICRHTHWCSVTLCGKLAACRRESSCIELCLEGREKTDRSGNTYWLYVLVPRERTDSWPEPRFDVADGKGERADPDVLHKVYEAFLDGLSLDGDDIAELRLRGIADEQVRRRLGYKTLDQRRASAARGCVAKGLEEHLPRVPGFYVATGKKGGKFWSVVGPGGLTIPVRDAKGRIIALLLRPRRNSSQGGQGLAKYIWLSTRRKGGAGPGAPVHVPRFDGPKLIVRITEGALKGDIATVLSGILTIAIPGVDAWKRILKVLREIGGVKTVRVALDADARRNRHVAAAIQGLVGLLREHGYGVELETWDEADGKGIDDLLAAGKTPRILTDEAIDAAVAEIVAAANGKPGGGGEEGGAAPAEAPGPQQEANATAGQQDPQQEAQDLQDGYNLILKYFNDRFKPTFRRGSLLYSGSLRREVRGSEACSAPTRQLVTVLEDATDAPRDEDGFVDQRKILKFFSDWAKVAWVDLLDSLPEEESADEVSDSAEAEFRHHVSAALHQLVSFGLPAKGKEGMQQERRSILDWAVRFAKSGPWKGVRSHKIWSRFVITPEGGQRLEIALRAELFSQVGYRHLAGLTQPRFARLCNLYAVGTSADADRPQGQRAVVLSQEFLLGLLDDLNRVEPPPSAGGESTPST